jgi:hypothetical protein
MTTIDSSSHLERHARLLPRGHQLAELPRRELQVRGHHEGRQRRVRLQRLHLLVLNG